MLKPLGASNPARTICPRSPSSTGEGEKLGVARRSRTSSLSFFSVLVAIRVPWEAAGVCIAASAPTAQPDPAPLALRADEERALFGR
jgi:hypothetical protein